MVEKGEGRVMAFGSQFSPASKGKGNTFVGAYVSVSVGDFEVLLSLLFRFISNSI